MLGSAATIRICWPLAARPVIGREALQDIPLGYLISLRKAETHHRNIRSAGLWAPAGPRLRAWVVIIVVLASWSDECASVRL
jgi:hypothetical protein